MSFRYKIIEKDMYLGTFIYIILWHVYLRTHIYQLKIHKILNKFLKINFYMVIFIDPIVSVDIMAAGILLIDQPLVLQCTAIIVENITSTVDIIWTTGNTQVRRVNNVTASSNINSSSIYNDSFIISSLNVSDIGSVYECEVVINSVLPTTAKTDFNVSIPGMYIYVHIFQMTFYECVLCSLTSSHLVAYLLCI